VKSTCVGVLAIRALCAFHTPVNISPTTRRHTPEYLNVQQHSCDNLRSFISLIVHRWHYSRRRWWQPQLPLHETPKKEFSRVLRYRYLAPMSSALSRTAHDIYIYMLPYVTDKYQFTIVW